MSFLKKNLFRLSGSRFIQNLLGKNIFISQYLMGIGSGTSVYSSGEKVLIKKLLELNLPELVIFDAGANQGQFADLIVSGLRAKINFSLHSFEPSRYSFEMLKKKHSSSKNIFLNNAGLGNKEGTAELFYEKEGSGLASLTKRNLSHFNIDFNKSEEVRITTIDSYCALMNVNRIDLLKIDVEGHELEVLEGAVKMFEKKSIRMATFEFGGCNIDTRTYYRDFFYFFKD
ncbi:MAG TPA: FkbM family methyltransferase [Ignavibacteriaceae bacterium]|nr:FkbM family methyltransferase [Ignavibacteriaceae bacterium]